MDGSIHKAVGRAALRVESWEYLQGFLWVAIRSFQIVCKNYAACWAIASLMPLFTFFWSERLLVWPRFACHQEILFWLICINAGLQTVRLKGHTNKLPDGKKVFILIFWFLVYDIVFLFISIRNNYFLKIILFQIHYNFYMQECSLHLHIFFKNITSKVK